MPKIQDLNEFRLVVLVGVDELLGQPHQTDDVIVVDVAEHAQVHGQRLGLGQAALVAQGFEPGLQNRLVHPAGSAVDEGKRGFVAGAVVQQQAVTLLRPQDFEAEDVLGHSVSPH